MLTASWKRKSNFGAIPKMHAQISSTLGLRQLIKHSTRITCHTSTLIDKLSSIVKKILHQLVLLTLPYLTISLFLGLGKARE